MIVGYLFLSVMFIVTLTGESFTPQVATHRSNSRLSSEFHKLSSYGGSGSCRDTVSIDCSGRRGVLKHGGGLVFGALSLLLERPGIATAAGTPEPKELERLQLGYSRVQYLLNNWDYVTSKCGSSLGAGAGSESKQVVRTDGGGGGACERDPIRVQEFIGYRSMNDPLFKADKLMMRALPLVPDDKVDDYQEAMEKFREKADDAAGLAFTSSWGEANPGGGKDVVDAYLERTKVYVIEVEKALKVVLACLDLKELPPLTGKL